MFIAGIDENGLGPRLGPMVVTGVLFEARGARYDPRAFERAFAGAASRGAARVADSKAVMASGDMAAGETTVLALAALVDGRIPRTAGAFLELVCGPGIADRRAACPPPAAPLCFGADEPLPLFGGDAPEAEALAGRLRDALSSEGLRLAAIESEALCPRAFNEFFRDGSGRGKADLDLFLFENRIASLARRAVGDALFLCGKVMNLANYAPRLGLLKAHPLLARSDGREESRYRLQDLGELRFLLDGDARHAPISAASMVGKYVREIFMARLNRCLAERIPGLRPASGYGDPATSELIRRATPLLEREGVPAECFLRSR